QSGINEFVCGALNPVRCVNIGRSTVRRVVFEAAILRRIVRGRDDNPIRQTSRPAGVVSEDRVRNEWRGSVGIAAIEHGFGAVCGQYFDSTRKRGFGKCVRIYSDEYWSVCALHA